MSIIKSIKQVLGLGPAAENHHWDGSVPNQLSLKRGTPDAPGAELIKALDGVLSFPNQGQALAANGYVKLPGGLIVQWGAVTTLASGASLFNYPISFPNEAFRVLGSANDPSLPITCAVTTNTLTNFAMVARNSAGAAIATGVNWIAIGY